MKIIFNLLATMLLLGSTLSLVGCAEKTHEDTSPPDSEIHLTTLLEGEFKGYADGDQVIISHGDQDMYLLITSDVIESLENIEVGDIVLFSFDTSKEGREILLSIRNE